MCSMAASDIEHLQYDVVIIGGGGSGLAAAVAASEKGAKTVLVEKRSNFGGNSALAVGLFATGSRIQKDMRVFVSADDAFRIMMDYSHLESDPKIVRAFLDKSGDTIQWLEEKGVIFDPTALMYDDHALPVWHCPVGGRGGADIVKILLGNAKELGVRLLCEAAAKSILKNKEGRVNGIAVAMKNGELRIHAKSVVIASGGHGSNKELLKKYHLSYSEDTIYLGTLLKGDGVLMAQEAGANTEEYGTLLYHSPFFPSRGRGRKGTLMQAILRQPCTIWVNKRGERFVDEASPNVPAETANAVDRQPGKVCYALFDEAVKQHLMEGGLERGAGYFLRPGAKVTDLDKQLNIQIRKGLVLKANSWSDIAEWIGASSVAIESTVDEYNRFCDQGYDRDFLKDRRHLLALRTPSYYAIKCAQTFLDTIGGIKVNHHMKVLDHFGQPIAGLYGAGVTAGGWEGRTYCMKLAGSAFGFAINSGRIAGENAAECARQQ
jgi:fumarate reductase flavoprotein subunit